ncbi:hypothetical protein [Citrobacter portucalensis]|nr:hypothetical protein [Citrobacter portucalensis]MDK2580506.1 hypothetical protein [Citrobacter portucalensis]
MAGITQQPSMVVVRNILYGHPLTIFGNGMFNRAELYHGRTPVL